MSRGTGGIVVMGPFRSETSLASRVLSVLGVDFGPEDRMLKADRFNPDGYFQRIDVRIANNRLIRSDGSVVAWPEHPQVLAARGNIAILGRARFDWTRAARQWGTKDPRFCATLLAWIEGQLLDPENLSIIRVERDIDDAASALLGMPELACQLLDRTLPSARSTVVRYADFAAWHAANLGMPNFTLGYATLLASPRQCVSDLSDFIGRGGRRSIDAAARCVRAGH